MKSVQERKKKEFFEDFFLTGEGDKQNRPKKKSKDGCLVGAKLVFSMVIFFFFFLIFPSNGLIFFFQNFLVLRFYSNSREENGRRGPSFHVAAPFSDRCGGCCESNVRFRESDSAANNG